MLLIKNANLYAPEHIGENDILIGGGKILRIQKNIDVPSLNVPIWNAQGKIVSPGFIDQHVHIT